MAEIFKKTVYFTIFQLIIWFIIASMQESYIYPPALTAKHYITMTLLFDGIFVTGLLQEHKKPLATLTLQGLNVCRIFIFFYLAATTVCFYMGNEAALTLLLSLTGYLLIPVYSGSNYWCCPTCGKRYGIRIWFFNHCPQCGKKLKKKANRRKS